MTLLRSYGGQSARQYTIVTTQIGGPSARHLRTLVANSEDALQNPSLVFENMACVKWFMDAIKYDGPVAFAGDCTKVRARLSYSNSSGGHVLGSTLPLDECVVDNSDDIEIIIDQAKSQKVIATQVCAILAKIPIPKVPPSAITLLLTTGSEDAAEIHKQHLLILEMAVQLSIKIISFMADGAASELAAQSLMDSEKTGLPPLVYEHRAFGIHVQAVVFDKTGVLVSVTDPSHAVKTSRNQPQHGTHTGSEGSGHLINHSLVDLYEMGISGLIQADVKDVDKQDDGAAHCLFHYQALSAMTFEEGGQQHIHEDMSGLFVYLFVLGELFDAWLNRKLNIESQLLAAFCARFFLHIWQNHIITFSAKYPDLYSTMQSFISPASFNIFNRLCDSLVALVLVYAMHYPNTPFCPWLLRTEFVKHFFGLARTFLPNFTYTQFLSLVKHVMLHQRILLSGKFNEKMECTSRAGYLFDFDNSPLSMDELSQACVQIMMSKINKLIEIGHTEASRISKDLLGMSVPALPFKLPPLSGPPCAKPNMRQQKQPDLGEPSSDSDDCSDMGEGIEDELANAMEQLDINDNDDDELSASTIASASADAARDSVLNIAHEEMRSESEDLLASSLWVLELPQSATMSSLETCIHT
ncbi:hypothetical protein EWM64_g5878 [Hericium alpestre]|uniref:Uncharacterized protein n=1 Tax=Hericium alpestre TaxID=135208 RepID=A0A4Y9ZX94_9AGAM|nr:hypothetical protein EWM64_g5878 [Hericium alpestre]